MQAEKIILANRISLDYPVGINTPAVKEFAQAAVAAVSSNLIRIFGSYIENMNLFCRGSSGAICAAMFTCYSSINCNIVHVKKKGEKSHANSVSEFNPEWPSVIIDDFIWSGNTMTEIYKAVSKAAGNPFYKIDLVIVDRGWDSLTEQVAGFIPNYVMQRY